MSIMLITHDLGVVAENADVVGVMYASRLVEFATVHELFKNPLHPYTKGLFKSIPRLGETQKQLNTIPGTVPNPADFPTGCKFHPRCAECKMETCSKNEPVLKEVSPGHWAACPFVPGHDTGAETRPQLNYRRNSDV